MVGPPPRSSSDLRLKELIGKGRARPYSLTALVHVLTGQASHRVKHPLYLRPPMIFRHPLSFGRGADGRNRNGSRLHKSHLLTLTLTLVVQNGVKAQKKKHLCELAPSVQRTKIVSIGWVGAKRDVGPSMTWKRVRKSRPLSPSHRLGQCLPVALQDEGQICSFQQRELPQERDASTSSEFVDYPQAATHRLEEWRASVEVLLRGERSCTNNLNGLASMKPQQTICGSDCIQRQRVANIWFGQLKSGISSTWMSGSQIGHNCNLGQMLLSVRVSNRTG